MGAADGLGTGIVEFRDGGGAAVDFVAAGGRERESTTVPPSPPFSFLSSFPFPVVSVPLSLLDPKPSLIDVVAAVESFREAVGSVRDVEGRTLTLLVTLTIPLLNAGPFGFSGDKPFVLVESVRPTQSHRIQKKQTRSTRSALVSFPSRAQQTH